MTDGMRWERVEQTILEALAVGNSTSMGDQELQEATGLDVSPPMHALRNLKEDGYIDAVLVQPGQADYPMRDCGRTFAAEGSAPSRAFAGFEGLSSAFFAALERAVGEEAGSSKAIEPGTRVCHRSKDDVGNMTLSAVIANAIGIGRSHLGLR